MTRSEYGGRHHCGRRHRRTRDLSEGKPFFFEKKQPETLVLKVLAKVERQPEMNKSFCFFFQKKRFLAIDGSRYNLRRMMTQLPAEQIGKVIRHHHLGLLFQPALRIRFQFGGKAGDAACNVAE